MVAKYVKKNLETDTKRNPAFQKDWHLTGEFRRLAHNKWILSTRKKCVSFVPFLAITFLDTIVIKFLKKLLDVVLEKKH